MAGGTVTWEMQDAELGHAELRGRATPPWRRPARRSRTRRQVTPPACRDAAARAPGRRAGVDHADLPAAGADLQQVAGGAGHPQDAAERREDHVGGRPDAAPCRSAPAASRTRGSRGRGSSPPRPRTGRSSPCRTIAWVWPPHTSISVQGRAAAARIFAISPRATAPSRYSSRYFMAAPAAEHLPGSVRPPRASSRAPPAGSSPGAPRRCAWASASSTRLMATHVHLT